MNAMLTCTTWSALLCMTRHGDLLQHVLGNIHSELYKVRINTCISIFCLGLDCRCRSIPQPLSSGSDSHTLIYVDMHTYGKTEHDS